MRYLALAWTLSTLCFSLGCSTTRKADEQRAVLHMQIGTGYLSQGMYPQAMNELLKAEKLDPKNPFIMNNVGLSYYVRGRLATAESKFREAIALKKDFSDAKNNLARTLIDQERFAEALKILGEVEGDLVYPFPDKTFSNLGMAHFQMGNFKKAEDYLVKSLQLRRDSCATSHFYGRTLFELKRIKQSAQVLDQAVDFCRPSKFEEPLFFSAMSYFSLGEKEKSRARLEELLKDYPKSKYVSKAKGMLELLQQ